MAIKLKIDFNFMGQQFEAGTIRSFGPEMDEKLLVGGSAEVYDPVAEIEESEENNMPDSENESAENKEPEDNKEQDAPPIGRKHK